MRGAAVAIADRLEGRLDIVEVDVAAGPSIEGKARVARYEAFASAAPPPASLLTAHTREDQAETVVMNLLRGAGLRGVSGIPVFRPPNIYRPFLDVSGSETREIATLASLPFLDDPMNQNPNLRRNVIRREVLPSLSRFNARLIESLSRLATSARLDSDYLDHRAARTVVARGDKSTRIPLGALIAADPVLANRVLASVIRSLRDEGPTGDELDRVQSVIDGDSAAAEIASGVSVSREGPMLVLSRDPSSVDEKVDVLLTRGCHRLGRVVLDVEEHSTVCRVAPIGVSSAIFPSTATLSASIKPPGEIVVSADGVPAWTVGVKRHPVAYYEPGSSGYLSVLATEESDEWTSSP
jgi:hypothetical protein